MVTIADVGELFVGRKNELELLRGLAAGLSAGVGGAVLVAGEQGIGKSSLLHAGLDGAAGEDCHLLWGAADELGQRFPLRLMAECLDLVGGLESAVAPVGRGERALAGDPVMAGVERLLAEVDRRCARSAVVLVAEDLQWADEASLLVWSRLCQAVGQLPLLLAGSYRPEPGGTELGRLRRGVLARGGTLVELGPLPGEEVAELVGGLVGGRPGRRLAGVAGQAGGNPLYARELADGLLRYGGIRVAEGVAELADERAGVPGSLAEAIGERLAALDTDVVEVLRWAAVLGVEFAVPDLEVVSGRSAGELLGAVAAAARAGVVADAGPRLRFRHGLIRQVLYESVPVALRSALHAEAARTLADAGVRPERVAAQLAAVISPPGRIPEPRLGDDLAGPGPGQAVAELTHGWVVDWLATSADVLIYRAPQVTADLLRAVLARLATTDPRRGALEASLATAAFLLVRHEEVERVGRAALTRASDPATVTEMTWLTAYTMMRTGRTAEGIGVVTRVLGQPGLTDAQTGRLTALHAILLTVLGRTDEADVAGQTALEIAERRGEPVTAGYALHALSCADYLRSDHHARLEHIGQALALIGDDQRAVDLRLLLLSNRPSTLMSLDRWEEAIVTAQQALVLAEQTGTPRLRLIRTALAHLYFDVGRWDDAIAELELAVDLPGPDYHNLLVHGLFALIAGHRGDVSTAGRHLAVLRDLPLRDAAYWSNARGALRAQALAAQQAHQPAEAVAILAQCLEPELAAGAGDPYELMPELVRAALACGQRAVAAEAARFAARWAQAEPLPLKTAVADLCRGLVNGEPATMLAAASYFQATGRVFDRALALEDTAALAAGHGDPATARQALAGALDLYESLGARWDAENVSARLRSLGIRRPAGGAKRRPASGWAALTPTEIRVAHLVADGRSNPDIAANLFLSRNTVQTHVSHILAKLGARSRAEIMRAALLHPPAGQPTGT